MTIDLSAWESVAAFAITFTMGVLAGHVIAVPYVPDELRSAMDADRGWNDAVDFMHSADGIDMHQMVYERWFRRGDPIAGMRSLWDATRMCESCGSNITDVGCRTMHDDEIGNVCQFDVVCHECGADDRYIGPRELVAVIAACKVWEESTMFADSTGDATV